jgi:D-glycero-alpha-D-manno-heptose 1-phosphate guanylyltransferase
MEAIVLAGGFGTRLQSVVNDVPKPMADINGKPFLSYLIEYLKLYKIDKIVLSIGYMSESIQRYYENIENIKFVIEDKPLGTGGAIKKALNAVTGNEVLVLNGDSFFNIDLDSFVKNFRDSETMMSIAVKPMNNFDRYGNVIIENSIVKKFEEKKFTKIGYINGGIYIIRRTIFDFFSENSERFSFETDFLARKVRIIRPIASVFDGFFIDIGIPEDYVRAKTELPNYFK